MPELGEPSTPSRSPAGKYCRTISTFSCDIARSISPLSPAAIRPNLRGHSFDYPRVAAREISGPGFERQICRGFAAATRINWAGVPRVG
jgi:hypothetical protein